MKSKIIGISITLITLLLIGTAADARHSHRGGGYSFSFGYYSGPPVVRVYPYYRNDVWIVYRDYDRHYYDRDYYGKYRYYKKYSPMELRDTGTSGPVTDMNQGITARDIFTVIRGIGVIGIDKT
jgi:hypothetical protein